jgi:hypothetical protein
MLDRAQVSILSFSFTLCTFSFCVENMKWAVYSVCRVYILIYSYSNRTGLFCWLYVNVHWYKPYSVFVSFAPALTFVHRHILFILFKCPLGISSHVEQNCVCELQCCVSCTELSWTETMTARNIDEIGKRGKLTYHSFGPTFRRFVLSRKEEAGRFNIFGDRLQQHEV